MYPANVILNKYVDQIKVLRFIPKFAKKNLLKGYSSKNFVMRLLVLLLLLYYIAYIMLLLFIRIF